MTVLSYSKKTMQFGFRVFSPSSSRAPASAGTEKLQEEFEIK
jgi:hypothetical protein